MWRNHRPSSPTGVKWNHFIKWILFGQTTTWERIFWFVFSRNIWMYCDKSVANCINVFHSLAEVMSANFFFFFFNVSSDYWLGWSLWTREREKKLDDSYDAFITKKYQFKTLFGIMNKILWFSIRLEWAKFQECMEKCENGLKCLNFFLHSFLSLQI